MIEVHQAEQPDSRIEHASRSPRASTLIAARAIDCASAIGGGSQRLTDPSCRHQPLDPFTKICTPLFVTRCNLSKCLRCGTVGVPGRKRRIGIVLKAQLDGPGNRLARDVGYHLQAEIDARCDSACGDQIPIPNDTSLFMRRTDQRQQLGVAPVRSRAAAFQQPGCA